MDGTAIFVVALLIALCLAGIAWFISQVVELETLPTRRQVERTIIPADWDRIMQDTQLERRKGKK
jgi:hypothetical protein